MSKITSVEVQKKNPHRFNIYLDGQFAFGADEDLVVEYRLIKDKVIDQVLLDKLLFEAEVGKLMERMYALFNKRARSEKEIRDYFRIKNYELRIKNKELISDLVIEQVIKKLNQKSLLNDEEFAKAWVLSRSKKKSIQAVKSELYKKGIDKEIIEEAVGFQSSAIRQNQTAEELLIKRLPRWQDLPYMDRKKKAFEFLLRRGFEYELVKEVVEKLLKK